MNISQIIATFYAVKGVTGFNVPQDINETIQQIIEARDGFGYQQNSCAAVTKTGGACHDEGTEFIASHTDGLTVDLDADGPHNVIVAVCKNHVRDNGTIRLANNPITGEINTHAATVATNQGENTAMTIDPKFMIPTVVIKEPAMPVIDTNPPAPVPACAALTQKGQPCSFKGATTKAHTKNGWTNGFSFTVEEKEGFFPVTVDFCGTHAKVDNIHLAYNPLQGKFNVQILDKTNEKEMILVKGIPVVGEKEGVKCVGCGERHEYSWEVKACQEVKANPEVIAEFEAVTKWFHFLRMDPLTQQPHRVMTNYLEDDERVAFWVSSQYTKPVGDIYALSNGNYKPIWLLGQLKGKEWRVEIADLSIARDIGGDMYLRRFRQDDVNFGFATADSAFAFRIKGHKGWDAKAFGINARAEKKVAKRLLDLVRMTEVGFYIENADKFSVLRTQQEIEAWQSNPKATWGIEIVPVDPDNPEFTDGSNVISTRMAEWIIRRSDIPVQRRNTLLKALKEGEFTLSNMRLDHPEFIVKGNLLKVDGELPNGVDMRVVDENIKGEFNTTGAVAIYLSERHPTHVASGDIQSLLNFFPMITGKRIARDIRGIETEVHSDIAEGKFPEYLVNPNRAHGSSQVPVEGEKMSAIERWINGGMELRASQHGVRMAFNGAVNKMASSFRDGIARKPWIPMQDALYGNIITHEVMELGGMEQERQGSKMYFDKRYGFIMPGFRFKETFYLHGTWDLDDTAKFIRIRVYGSPEAVANLREDNVLARDAIVPTEESEAVEAVLVIRSPNGPGEYSIEFLADGVEVDWWKPSGEPTIINLDNAPRGVKYYESLTRIRGMDNVPATYYHGGDFTREDFHRQMKAHLVNLGIGSVADISMVWYETTGMGFPAEIVDTIGNLVDVFMQEWDEARILAAGEASELIAKQLVTYLKKNPEVKIDRNLVKARASYLTKKPFYLPQKSLGEGRFTKIEAFYRATYNELSNHVENMAREIRFNSPLVKSLKAFREDKKTRTDALEQKLREAGQTRGLFWKAFKQIQDQFKVSPDDNAFVKATKAAGRSEAMGNLARETYEYYSNLENPEEAVMFAYVEVVTSEYSYVDFQTGERIDMPHGYSDHMFFTARKDDGPDVMALLISALNYDYKYVVDQFMGS